MIRRPLKLPVCLGLGALAGSMLLDRGTVEAAWPPPQSATSTDMKQPEFWPNDPDYGYVASSQPAERKLLDRFERNFKKAENTCPEASWLPTGLAGVEVVLVQSVRDGIDAELWARRWDTVLTCAGVHVRRHRYSSAVPLSQLLDEPEV